MISKDMIKATQESHNGEDKPSWSIERRKSNSWFKHILFHKVYMRTNTMYWEYIINDQNESNDTYLALLLI